jgi:hypothetical protein
MALLYWLGVLIAIGSAIAFAALGLLAGYGGLHTTRAQILPGFRPDRPGPLARAATLAAVWVPVLVVAIFGVYACVHILGVALAAL